VAPLQRRHRVNLKDEDMTPPIETESAAALVFDTAQTPLQRVRSVLHRYPALSPAVVLLISIIVFGMLNERFLLPGNLSLITQQVAIVGTVALAQTLIILTAGIDLSVGTAMVLASMVMAVAASENGVAAPVALLMGLVVGLLSGLINGMLVTKLKLPPFIVTLGTYSIFLALTLLYSKGSTVRGSDMPALMTWTGKSFPVGGVSVSYGVVIMFVMYVVMAWVLSTTAWGRHLYAVGDDPEAARLAGVRTTWVLRSVYISAGSIIAIAAWLQIGRTSAASPNAGADLNLDSITAVVIGGTSLFGGRGTVWGTLLGALIVGVFRNGLSLAGLDVLYQTLAVGVLVIVAVSLDQWIRKAR
jgi:fructose transport system permease protein